MRAVLGIDAAWTAARPSGVALAVETATGWRLVAAEASYDGFIECAAGRPPTTRPTGATPDVPALLAAATRLAGQAPALVAVDMPLAHTPITCRRTADDAVSRAYGGRSCGTHSPSAARPGALADTLRHDFAAAGYPLLTEAITPLGLVEVYPHPALVEWMQAPARLPYKVAKTRTYWPDLDRAARSARLIETWADIDAALDRRVAGVTDRLRAASALPAKAREDLLDAIICCAVAIDALDGRAIPFGDADAAIWIPAAATARSPVRRSG